MCALWKTGVYDGLTYPFSTAGAWIACLSSNQILTAMKPMRIKHLWTAYFLMSNDFKNYFWDRGRHTHRLCKVHHETPYTTSPLGFGLKSVLHKEAQQQLKRIFKFLLACCILGTYSMKTFGILKKKILKMPKISMKLENLKLINTVVMKAGSCCAFTLGLKPCAKLENLCSTKQRCLPIWTLHIVQGLSLQPWKQWCFCRCNAVSD